MTAERTINPEEFDLFEVAQKMRLADVPDGFVAKALDLAHEYRGIKDLMMLWMDAAGEADEQDEILADIQDMLNEVLDGPTRHVKERYVRFDDLDAIAADIMSFKDSLRLEVEEQCTLTELAERTGMPLPSLSRFFSRPSMPRRATLLKIAEALDLSAVEIAGDWTV